MFLAFLKLIFDPRFASVIYLFTNLAAKTYYLLLQGSFSHTPLFMSGENRLPVEKRRTTLSRALILPFSHAKIEGALTCKTNPHSGCCLQEFEPPISK